jgi:hypothetical protein
MVFSILLAVVSSAIVPGLFSVNAQSSPELPIEEVIRRFAAAESENKRARVNYAFKQDVDILSLGEAGSVLGRFKRVSEIILDDRGNRIERITYFPPPTLNNMTAEDMQDISGVQPFALSTEDIPKYDVKYQGKEKIDELNTYVFDVQPKQLRKGERYFEGRIWVDDLDLQIVKVAGKAVPQFDNNKFPRFETYRENIDGRFWFPTYTYADDVLVFKKGPDLHIKMTIRYTDYKRFAGDIKLIDDDESGPAEEGGKKPASNPRKPPEEPDRRH